MKDKMILIIPSDTDRRAVSAVLVANGYIVYTDKVAVGKSKRTVLVAQLKETSNG